MIALAMLMALGMYTSNVSAPASGDIDLTMDLATKHWSIAPFRAPSHEHPLGTLAVAGVEDGDAIVIEWDLAENREIHRKKIADDVKHAAMTSDGEHLFVAVDSDRVVLVELDASLGVVDRRELGVGGTPSVAANDKWLVVGYFEERQPNADSITSKKYDYTTHHAMHVTTVSRTTHSIAASKVFLGPHMLVPPSNPAYATQAITLRGDTAYLALPSMGEVTVESVKLPSLGTPKTKTFDKLGWWGHADLRFEGDDLRVKLPGEDAFLSTSLAPRKHAAPADPWKRALEERGCQETVFVWSHPVTICAPTEQGRSAVLFSR